MIKSVVKNGKVKVKAVGSRTDIMSDLLLLSISLLDESTKELPEERKSIFKRAFLKTLKEFI